MKRAALYVRVSTEEQKRHGLSVDSQVEALKRYATEHEYHVHKIYNDAGISARKRFTRRPALLQLMEDCKAKKIDIILFTKLDRWFRSVSDYYEVQAILDKNHIPWRAIWEDYETETSAGVFKVNIMLSVAQAESDRSGERIKAVWDYKKERGDYAGPPPFGYKVNKGQLLIKEEEREMCKAFFDTYLKTLSLRKSCEKVAELGGKGTRNHYQEVLQNPAYYGLAQGRHKCEAYITKEQFDFIQTTLRRAPRRTKVDTTYLFSGLVICGYCGKRMNSRSARLHLKRDPNKIWKAYVCQADTTYPPIHKNLSFSEHIMEKALLDNLEVFYHNYEVYVEAQNNKIADSDNEKQINALTKKLDRLKVLFVEGDIEIADYKTKRDELTEKLQALENREEKLLDPSPLPEDWRTLYDSLDEEHKAIFWRRTIKRMVVVNEDKYHPFVEFY